MSLEKAVVFALGGMAYGLLELLWRGWTHWTMPICGGICFLIMYVIARLDIPLVRKWILSAAGTVTVEFYTGCIVNLSLGWSVWDYSDLPYNLLGQICLRFSLMWLALSVPGTALCSLLRNRLSKV